VSDFKQLISLIQNTVDQFNKQIPGLQTNVLNQLLKEINSLDTKDGRIKIAGSNLRAIASIKGKLQKLILSPEYLSSVGSYTTAFNEVTRLQNDYFNSVSQKFSPPKLTKEIKKQAMDAVLTSLTQSGIDANVITPAIEIFRKAVTGGAGAFSLQKQITDLLTENETGPGQLQRYATQITTDALNQFSGQYTQIISNDLGFEWFRYSGSNIETTRPFCLACTDRKYFHISELPEILKGNFPEFDKYDGKINKKTGLPTGMIPGTDVSNFMTNRGGYNCGHQWRPVSEDLVPAEIKNALYATALYQSWAKANNKIVPEIPKPKPAPAPEPPKPTADKLDLKAHGDIKNIYDVNKLFKDQEQAIKKWFNNTTFKKVEITHAENINGRTDMNGNISLSPEKARLFSEALDKIRQEIELSLDNEKAIATMWHEIWHNRNQSDTVPDMTRTQRRFMELGNEFVARKTLDEFMDTLGTKLKHESLKSDRDDTGYNTMVRNYEHLIKYFKASPDKVLEFLKEKMETGSYTNVKSYLVDAIVSSGDKLKKREVEKAVAVAIQITEKFFIDIYTIR